MKQVIICQSVHKGCTAKIAAPAAEMIEAEETALYKYPGRSQARFSFY